MTESRTKLRFSFQTKVLVPVLTALFLVPAVTLWIVDRSISRQVQDGARQTLITAESVFRQLLELRARTLVPRFSNAANESSYRSLTQIFAIKDPGARETVRKFLNERLAAYGEECEALLLASDAGTDPVIAHRGTVLDAADFARDTAQITKAALQGTPAHAVIEVHGNAYLMVSVPVTAPESGLTVGALTAASRVGDVALQEFKSITGADIFLVSDQAVTSATLHQAELSAALIHDLSGGGDRRILPLETGGEHYLALTDTYTQENQTHGFRYVLLSSYEQRWREQQHSRTTLVEVSLAGILLSGFFVWLLIRRITHPLQELRDHAEAVGRGDFTRRLEHYSADECGAVAVAFNGMTENLQASRSDLEKAMGSLKTTQAQLVQSEKLSAVGQFVAGVAHELNNPLTSVIGFADLLAHTELEDQYKDFVKHIGKNAARCHKIVNSLLGFSRQHEPERKLIQLHDVTDEVVEIVSYDLRTSNIVLKKEYQPGLPAILGDAHQLQQVVLNIISNARQAMDAYRRDGQIILTTGATDTHVWLRIKDNGPGIPRESLTRIFDPFFTTKPQGKGTGLGLSLSYGIIQEHHGRIHAESQPGEGAEFVLELPIPADQAAADAQRPKTIVPFAAGAPRLSILVIDDEESILHLVREILRTEGHLVETATSGEAGLEMIRRKSYDVIISDWKMPGLNGINLFQELLAKNPAVARRMIFMTGDVIKESFQEFLQTHGRTCLAKPFALREFHLAIAGVINPV